MPSRRHFLHRRTAWWHATIDEFHRSGQSPEAFARSINARPATLLYWCKLFAAQAASAPSELAVGPPRFVEVSLAAASQPVSTTMPRTVVEAQVGALSLRVLADADPVFAGTLLAVLAKAVAPC